jgi:hypothetical protein
MKDTPVAIDLTDLWRRLGISVVGRNVTLRANAPLAAIRLAITATFTSNNR